MQSWMFKMPKNKLSTPEWVLQGYDSPAEYEKSQKKSGKKKTGKTFKIRKCPKCGSFDVEIVLTGNENKKADSWKCQKCRWKGKDVGLKEMDEEEFIKCTEEKNK